MDTAGINIRSGLEKMHMIIQATHFFCLTAFLVVLSGCSNAIDKPPSLSNTTTRTVAENTLYPTPAATLGGLVNGLSSDDPLVRIVSANALENYGDDAKLAIPALRVNLYYADSSEVRRSAALALGRMNSVATEAVPDLIFVIENDYSPGVVFSAVESIGNIGDASAIPYLAVALECESRFYENRNYGRESCLALAIVIAETIGRLAGEHFTDSGSNIYTLNADGTPQIVVDARKWWSENGQFEDWHTK